MLSSADADWLSYPSHNSHHRGAKRIMRKAMFRKHYASLNPPNPWAHPCRSESLIYLRR